MIKPSESFLYIEPEDFEVIFRIIYENFSHHELAPDYQSEKEGIKKLLGVLKGVKMDAYYPDIYDKSSYLLLQINKGHFFSNGNKRAALALTLVFVYLNLWRVGDFNRDEYKKKLQNLFPSFQNFEDFGDFSPEEFGFYNLSIIVADSEKFVDSFEDLKGKVRNFLEFVLRKQGE